jgi:hypothetical protein
MNIKEELKSGGDKLSFFQELYKDAESRLEESFSTLERHYEQYKGSKEIDGENGMRAVDASLVRNITYELIESQITGYIPNAKVDARMFSNKNARNAEAIEKLCEMTLNRIGIEALNDMDERYTYIYGGSIFLVEWDESITTHNSAGDIRISCISPRNFVPQPNIYTGIQDMEYCFVKFTTTKEGVVRKYGISEDLARNIESDEGEDTATLIVCYYKNDEGKVCEYVWAEAESGGNAIEILDIDDYYSRKRKICTKCGKYEGLCTCEKPKFETVSEEYEEINHDIIIDGEVAIPARSEVIKDGVVVTEEHTEPKTSANGLPQFDVDESGNMTPAMATVATPVTEPTKIPFYRPNRLPIVIRKNTSQEDSLLGQSDCEFIRPQQQAINKIESRILEKLLKSAITPVMPEDATITLNNSIFGQIIKMKPGETVSQYGKVDTTPDISKDIAEAERLYDHAKRILGINSSFQGQYDSSAASGVAKQLQINQASGRLESKRRMKNHAYAEIYEIIFQFYLANADEPRPISFKDATGKVQNVQFNRLAFVERDEAGEYYYNDEFLFDADSASDVEQYRQYLWEHNMQLYKQGTFGDPNSVQSRLTYWRNMERAHYPFAHAMVEETEAQMNDEISQLQAQLAGVSTELNERKGYEEYLRGGTV